MRSVLRYIATLPPIARQAMKLRERYKAAKAGPIPTHDENGLPVPDALHMMTVVAHADWEEFRRVGLSAITAFAELAARNGKSVQDADRILDFGVGCGRLIRHLPEMTKADLYGVDYNSMLIDWCTENLPGTYLKNELKPPLKITDDQFDILYALSVFTHLREDTQRAWLAEFARITKPGGLCLVTFHDETHPDAPIAGFSPDDIRQQRIAYYNNRAEGSNLLSTFQSQAHMTEISSPYFDVAEIVPAEDTIVRQAVAVLRAR